MAADWDLVAAVVPPPDQPLRPTLLLGLNRVAWPPRLDGACPACGGAPIPTIGYCLACHRSGQDHRLPHRGLLGRVHPERVPDHRPRRKRGKKRLRGGVG